MNAHPSASSIQAEPLTFSGRLTYLRKRLEGLANQPLETTPSAPQGPQLAGESSVGDGAESSDALTVLTSAFGLSPFEADILVLCAGVEIDTEVTARVRTLQAAPGRTLPTVSFVLSVLEESHWSAFLPEAPLRQWRFIELGAGETLRDRPLQLDERILHALLGFRSADQRLHGYIAPYHDRATALPPSAQSLVERIVALRTVSTADRPHCIQLIGRETTDLRPIVAEACRQLGLRLHVLHGRDIPTGNVERAALARLWEREAILEQSALLVELDGSIEVTPARHFIECTRTLIFLTSGEPIGGLACPHVRLEVPRISPQEQLMHWRAALGEEAASLNGAVHQLAAHFDLGPETIEAVCVQAQAEAPASDPDRRDLGGRLWRLARTRARQRLDALAQRIEPRANWEDLILPERQLQTLREMAAQLRHRLTVYDDWGFGRKSGRGLGISALFTGPSGVGKTLASEVLANELVLDLYKIDLSQVVSKYIGETEKNLRRVFDAAEAGGAILLFDEADALFGKRTEVKDSHDRYANIECSYLLQRMEHYRGLAILTTNMKQALDQALLRRLRFIVAFPFPNAESRAAIWRQVFPQETPTKNLDAAKLARLNLTGGHIHNIAMQAAFLAADAGEPVGMAHVRHAARGEYEKLDKPLPERDWRDWA